MAAKIGSDTFLAMDKPKPPPVSDALLLQLGVRFKGLLDNLSKIEDAHRKLGPKRSANHVRVVAQLCILSTMEAIRESACILYDAGVDQDSYKSFLEEGDFPTPLSILGMELVEARCGRPCRLFAKAGSTAGTGGYVYYRELTQAFAAAALEVLIENGLKETDASKRIEETLAECEFRKPGNGFYSSKTIEDWRTVEEDGKKKEFHQHLCRARLDLRGLVGPEKARGLSNVEIQKIIIRKLRSRLEHIAYRL